MATARKRRSKGETLAGQSSLEGLLGWRFVRADLLQLALTHRSFVYESRMDASEHEAAGRGRNAPGEDNEQLEFLGDAVLGLVVTEALFREFPECTEGELTRMRASLVSRERMAVLGEALGLGELLLLGKSAERSGIRQKPALLANAAEAVLAAVYLDAKDRAPKVIRDIVSRLLVEPELGGLRAAVAGAVGHGALRDGKTLLQERVQAENAGKLRYVDTEQTGPAHQRRFTVEAQLEKDGDIRVLATGEGGSKKEAQQRAATLAFQQWIPAPADVEEQHERGVA